MPRPSWVAAVIAAGLLWPAASDTPVRAVEPDALVQSGYQLLWSGDEAAAERHFDGLIKQKPGDLAARFGLLMAEHERLDADDALAPVFERGLDALIDVTDKRLGRDERDGDALYYRAFGRMLRAVYKLDNDTSALSAVRDAARAKGDMETYLKSHPDDADASMVVGVYNYFASLAPTYMHIVRFLLFLPASDRAAGLRQIERAAKDGRLFAPEAQQLLVEIYSTYEGRPADALAIAQRLQHQYPRNDEVGFAVADLHQSPSIEDRAKAEEAYTAIVARHEHDASPDGAAMRYRALLGLAGVRFDEWKCEEAIEALTPTIEAQPPAPAWVLPQFLLGRANYRLLVNDARGADDARRVQRDPAMGKWHKDATGLLGRFAKRTGGEAAIYAGLVPANRLVAERRWEAARAAYAPFVKAHPQDSQVRYRLAYLDFVSGDPERARPVFGTLANTKVAPDWLRAWSFVYEGRADDLAGRRDVARREYQTVVDTFEKLRAADAARVGLVTPYRWPAAAGPIS